MARLPRCGVRTPGADVRRLKVAAAENALPSLGGGLLEELHTHPPS